MPYHDGHRQLQDHFDSRRLADRLDTVIRREKFSQEDRAFIAAAAMFFLATADSNGQPDCSYKGGRPGFVRVLDDATTLIFPSYDGNGMFRSMGNIVANPHVGLLFIDFASPRRLRVNGTAAVHTDDALLNEFVGAEMLVRVHAVDIFPNCPRYIHIPNGHVPGTQELSKDAPAEGHTPPEPEWKRMPAFAPYLPSKP